MRIHFIAIGGSAMHNLAIALKQNGHQVSGSDDEIFEPSRSRLKKYGLLPENEGWNPELLTNDIEAIVLGMHAKADNPELLRAQQLDLKIFSYPEFLYFHSKNKKRVVIGGSHGKTTITGMVMHVLKKAGIQFDYMVGSKLKDFEVMVQLSEEAPIMIFEGDEYLTSPIDLKPKFHWYKPHLALLTGIAWDHINVFPTFENYVEQFRIFIDLMEKTGTLIYNEEDEILKDLVLSSGKKIKKIPYALPAHRISKGTTYLVSGNDETPLKIFGKHNLSNLNGARFVCNSLGIPDKTFYNSISDFEGAANRLELIAEGKNAWFYKDFAHAPSKVKATVEAVREQFPASRLVVCLELHTFSSLSQNFLQEYAGTLSPADVACVYFNPHAISLKRLPPLSVEKVKEVFDYENLTIFEDSKKLVHWLEKHKGPDTVYLCMSSGNFDGIDLPNISKRLV
jgi:UDP-N-acetylmuramate: L-alanyl-gamma-D-glutamyl-meso-diaminopimelate ligase